jgi:mono/diheme cytochrome c family protein
VRRALGPSLALAVALAGCGESGQARAVFVWQQRCAPCHALAPGKPSPAVAAPNLGDHPPSAAQLRRAVLDGLPGMPKDLAGESDLPALGQYIREASKK